MGVREFFGLTPKPSKQTDTLGRPTRMFFDWNNPDEMFFWPMTREEALEIPGVARVHHMIVSKLAQLELFAVDVNGVEVPRDNQPTAFYRTDLGEPPEFRMWCTADDLYFYGKSLWLTTRGSLGQLMSASWCPEARWEVSNGQVFIDEQLARPGTFILFNIPLWSGMLNMGRRTLHGARDIERAWTSRMKTPPSLVELSVTDESVTQDEIDDYQQRWLAKRANGGMVVGATPPGIELKVHSNSLGPADLFLQARDSIRTDIGSHSSVDGGMADSTASSQSLTYETNAGQRADFYEFDLPFWTTPITARLSMDDVVPRGQRVLTRFRPVVAPDRTATQDQKETIRKDASAPATESAAPSTEENNAEDQAAA